MNVSMSQKVLSFARDRNDFFCAHEIGSFFNDYDFKKLSAIVGKLKQDGKLTMTDVTEPCKMQSKKHHFYIFNKRQNEIPKIDENGEDRKNKPEISKKRKEVFELIKESVLKQTGEFCRHTIAKETNISAKKIAPYLKQLKEKRKLKYIGKKDCPEGERTHKFYIVVNKNLKNVKIIHKGQKQKSKGDLLRTSRTVKIIQKSIKIEKTEGDLGVFISCLSCGMNYIGEKADIMNKGFTSCPKCQHKIVIGT